VRLFLANITYLSAKSIKIHLLSYPVVDLNKVVKPPMSILDESDSL
jgi:hypothetical protein